MSFEKNHNSIYNKDNSSFVLNKNENENLNQIIQKNEINLNEIDIFGSNEIFKISIKRLIDYLDQNCNCCIFITIIDNYKCVIKGYRQDIEILLKILVDSVINNNYQLDKILDENLNSIILENIDVIKTNSENRPIILYIKNELYYHNLTKNTLEFLFNKLINLLDYFFLFSFFS